MDVILNDAIVPISSLNIKIPESLANVINNALLTRARDRYPDGASLLEALILS